MFQGKLTKRMLRAKKKKEKNEEEEQIVNQMHARKDVKRDEQEEEDVDEDDEENKEEEEKEKMKKTTYDATTRGRGNATAHPRSDSCMARQGDGQTPHTAARFGRGGVANTHPA